MGREKIIPSKKTAKKTVEEVTQVPLKFHMPDTIITGFATNITVQILENEFKICFFEQKPKIYFPPTPPPSEVQADCVASVIVTPDRLPKFIKVLQDQLDKYNARPPEIKE